MRRTIACLVIAGMLADCGSEPPPDPWTCRVAQGSEALVAMRVVPGKRKPMGFVSLIADDDTPDRMPALDGGTRLLVIDDIGRGEENLLRQVHVEVREGPQKGRTGSVMRGSMRPAE